MYAAAAPSAPSSAAVTSIENEYVRIQWVAPDANSATIDGYDVEIAKKDGTFIREATYCDGFTS